MLFEDKHKHLIFKVVLMVIVILSLFKHLVMHKILTEWFVNLLVNFKNILMSWFDIRFTPNAWVMQYHCFILMRNIKIHQSMKQARVMHNIEPHKKTIKLLLYGMVYGDEQ